MTAMNAHQGSLLEVEGLSTWLDTARGVLRVVDGVSFGIAHGETFALVGESGCGKSMTALSLMRLLPEVGHIVGGRVVLEGTDLLALSELSMRSVRGSRMAMIFQEPALSLNPVMPVGAQIVEVLVRHTDLEGSAAVSRARELLEWVGIPDAARHFDHYSFQLSGGMKQRVMIAVALACHPGLLIADEPTTALDVTIQAQVLELLRRLQRDSRMSILLITHDLGVVSEMAHRIAVMYAGEIVEIAPRARFFGSPAHPYSAKLFEALPGGAGRDRPLAVIPGTVPPLDRVFSGCRFADRCDRAWSLCRQRAPEMTDIGGGQHVRCHLYSADLDVRRDAGSRKRQAVGSAVHQPAAAELACAPLLQVEDLKVYFPIRRGLFKRVVGHVKAVDGVSLEIPSHRTVALVGESGCGKTTVGKGILQLVPTAAGCVTFEGKNLCALSRKALRPWRRDFQIIFQDPYHSLNPRMRVMEIVEEGMAALGVGTDRAQRQQRVDALLAQVGLQPDMKLRYPHEFSGGQRQRIAIARALAVEPKLIICDEPTSALDVSVQAQILNLLKELQLNLGIAYLFITHNISVVEFLAHEVAVMYLGRIVEKGSVQEVLGSPRHPYTRALLSAVPAVDEQLKREIIRLQGELPSAVNPPAGCHFHPRCPDAMPVCRQSYPVISGVSATHEVRCHLCSSQAQHRSSPEERGEKRLDAQQPAGQQVVGRP
jgi:peptide/nickel transport system ATP-binding protein